MQEQIITHKTALLAKEKGLHQKPYMRDAYDENQAGDKLMVVDSSDFPQIMNEIKDKLI